MNTLIRIANVLNIGLDTLLYDKLNAARGIASGMPDAKLENLLPDSFRVVSDFIDLLLKHMDKLSGPP